MEATQKKSALSVNMTEGSLWKNMLLFSLPLMLTQVLEVLFNLSDVAIAGKFADYRALGAVGLHHAAGVAVHGTADRHGQRRQRGGGPGPGHGG